MKRLWGIYYVSLCLVFLSSCGGFGPEATISSTISLVPTATKISTRSEIQISTPPPTETQVFNSYDLDPAQSAEDCLAADLPEIACTGVTANQQWTPIVRRFNQVEMVLVPAGCFMMGYENDEFEEEKPVHQMCIDRPFWIDRTEVTVSQFANFLNGQPEPLEDYYHWLDILRFVNDPGLQPHIQLKKEEGVWLPRGRQANRPQEYVTWIGANDFCNWRGARLPNEAEWEYAARGPNNLIFPWGDEFSEEYVVRRMTNNPDVGSKPQGVSWVGAVDMSGSMFEWTSSLYRPYPFDPGDGREVGIDLDPKSRRVFRGSALYHDLGLDNVSATARFDAQIDFANWYFGVRCVRPID